MSLVDESIMFLSIAVAGEAITEDQAKACLTAVTQQSAIPKSKQTSEYIKTVMNIDHVLTSYSDKEFERVFG